jgi:hypothetical protein
MNSRALTIFDGFQSLGKCRLLPVTSGLSQSNYYYKGDVFFVCPLLLNRSRYPSNNVPI